MIKDISNMDEYMYKFFINKNSIKKDNQKNLLEVAKYILQNSPSDKEIKEKSDIENFEDGFFKLAQICALAPPYKYKINNYEFIIGNNKIIAFNENYTKKEVVSQGKYKLAIKPLTKKELKLYSNI